MKCLTYLTVAVLAGFILASPAFAQVTVGVYDPDSANDVDQSGIFSSATGSASAANVLTVDQFSAEITEAFAAGTGGVLDLEGAGAITFPSGNTGNVTGLGSFRATFNNGDSTNQIDFAGNADPQFITGEGGGGQVATSGEISLGLSAGATYDFGGFFLSSDVPDDVGITSFGATLLQSNAGNQTYQVTATFEDVFTNDESTLLFEDLTFDGAAANTLDTFFGVTAPDGSFITGLEFTNTSGGALTLIDDIGFVTGTTTAIPEPSSLALVSLLTGLVVVRRRRK